MVDSENPFFEVGTTLRGHEFHYSGIVSGKENSSTAFSVNRGTGCYDLRDGLVYKNVLAGYIHLHTVGTPEWVRGFIRAARKQRESESVRNEHSGINNIGMTTG
jgi:cobyrinic acid a,c-diamide synthase